MDHDTLADVLPLPQRAHVGQESRPQAVRAQREHLADVVPLHDPPRDRQPDAPAHAGPRPGPDLPAESVSLTESVPVVEVDDLFSLDSGSSWINGCQGVTIGSVSCPATVASAFSFT